MTSPKCDRQIVNGKTETIGYDANDHATTIDNGTTTVNETLHPGGRVLERKVTNHTTHAVTEDTVYGYQVIFRFRLDDKYDADTQGRNVHERSYRRSLSSHRTWSRGSQLGDHSGPLAHRAASWYHATISDMDPGYVKGIYDYIEYQVPGTNKWRIVYADYVIKS